MDVKQMIKELSKLDPDAVVVVLDSDGKGWTNVDKIRLFGSAVGIQMDDGMPIFMSDRD